MILSLWYLAPESIDGGRITQKVDVYAFRVVLLELMIGQRNSDLQCYKGQVLSEWFHPLVVLELALILEKIYCLIDPYLYSKQAHNFTNQLQAMAHAASLCLTRDLESGPPMQR